MKFNSKNCTHLELLPKNVTPQSFITLKQGDNIQSKNAFSYLITFKLSKNKDYEIEYNACNESYAYIYNCDDVLNSGIEIITPQIQNSDNTYLEAYHFTPPTGWLNDPNGLCFYGGVYHLYYQFYPHAQKWGNMHWGHAVSENLINWRHMPVFLTPQQNLLENKEYAGGAFSGSAVCEKDNLRFFLTRHYAPQSDESKMVEYQTMLTSKNGIKPENESVIIENTNAEHLYHFRDPKVFTHRGINYLVLGSAINKKACILLYRSANFSNWEYIGPVLSVMNDKCETVECPDMFELDEKFVCVAAQMTYVDESKRISPVYWYIGDFTGKTLLNTTKGLYDFGANFYAVQSFEHDKKRIAIGWINDFYNEHRKIEGGVCGSMSLPRELSIKNNKLYQRPVEQIYALKNKLLYSASTKETTLKIENNHWYAAMQFDKPTDFSAIIAQDNEKQLSINCLNGNLYIKTDGVSGGLRLNAECSAVAKLEIFADGRTFEFFVNDGEAAAAKTFYSERRNGHFQFKSADMQVNIKIFSMKTAGEATKNV